MMTNLNRKQKRLIFTWAAVLISFYILVTGVASVIVGKDKTDALLRHNDRIDANSQEPGRTWIDPTVLKRDQQKEATKVSVGMYVDHIVDLSTISTNWTVDFYIWFRWKDPNIHPGDTFQIMDGEILSCDKVDSTNYEGTQYELYRVVAKITKFFNVTRFPRDNHMLTIPIENKVYTWQQMQYVPDIEVSDVSSRVILPDYKITKTYLVTKPHPYKTNRGDPRQTANTMIVYDQIIYGLAISRPDWGLYFKMFESLFASVAIALLVFFMNPQGDGRVGLGIGAFFAAVASSYVTTSELPGIGVLTLSDLVNILGMVTIFLSVLCSIVVMKIAEKENQLVLARIFDKLSLVIFLSGYILANAAIAMIAS
ncbi:MAG: hypothetical protein WC384_17425 [Prolixibacteraceae bacterium]|jgi:hypothetical protein